MPNFTCPSGGTWHACATGSRFVGCCTQTDACTLGCSAGNLMPASFDTALSGRIPDLDCGTSGSLFYTCAVTDPSFWGCCKSDPCSNDGCARTDLGAAYLGANAVAGAYYGVTGTASASASASATGSAAATLSSSSLMPSSSSSSSSPSSSPSSTSSSNATTIIAAAIGGVAGGILIAAALAFVIWQRARRHHRNNGPGIPDSERTAATAAFMETKRGAPPTTAAPEKQLAGTAGILLDGPDAASSPLLLLPPHHQPNGVGIFELESGVDVREQQPCAPPELVELMAEPVERVELAAGREVVTQSVVAGRRGSAAGSGRLSVDSSVASSVKHAQRTDDVATAGGDGDDGVLDVPQVSPQSASFDLGRNNRDSGVSSLRSLPRTPVVGQWGEVLLEDED